MDKPKILFISRAYPPTVGGIENQNYELGKWLGELTQVKIIANKNGKKFLPLFLPLATLQALWQMRSFNALLLGDGVLGITGWFVKLFHPQKPVLCVVHGLDLTFKNDFYQKMWVNFFLPKLDKFIAVGNETVRVAEEKKIAPEKIVFIPNGVDTEKHLVQSSKHDLEKILGVSLEDKKVLLTSGRLAKRKGVAWFVRHVLPKLPDNVIYVIAGNGPDKASIEFAIADTKAEGKAFMLGYVTDEVRNILFATSDLFIQPNIKVDGDMEGFGISVIEAAACRLPVVAAEIEGLKDAIKNEQNGFLVESANTKAWQEKIAHLLADKHALRLFGEKARQFVVENYSWHIIAEKYLTEINKTIKETC